MGFFVRCKRLPPPERPPLRGSISAISRTRGLMHRLYSGNSSPRIGGRSEEHTSELQSRENLVCRLLLEKKKKKQEEQPTLTQSGKNNNQIHKNQIHKL